MYLYNRSKHCSAKLVNDALHIHSSLIDDVHEMILDMVIGSQDMVIREIAFIMMRVPYGYCKEVQKKAEEMKGIVVGPGISRLAKEKFGESSGCYHLLDLFLEGIKVYKQGSTRLLFKNNDKKALKLSRDKMKDTCYYFSKINQI